MLMAAGNGCSNTDTIVYHLVVEMWADLYESTRVFADKGRRNAYYQLRVRQETGLPDAAWCEVKAAYDDLMSCQQKFEQLYCATATVKGPSEAVSRARRA